MATPILEITEVTTGSAQNTVINQAIRDIESSIYEQYDADLTSGNVTITNVTPTWYFLRNGVFRGHGHTVSRTLTFPAAQRIFQVWNDGTGTIDATIGSSSVTVPVGSIYRLYCDGGTNSIKRVS